MFINEVSKITNLTKKAIEYYEGQCLIFPSTLENGYRDFNEADIDCLKKISVLRKLGISTQEIKEIFADQTGNTIQLAALHKELNFQREQAKKSALDKLSRGESYESISAELKAMEQNATVTEKLLESFPGYYGRFICLHFSRFLNQPIETEEQEKAYEKIVCFLDNVAPLRFPEDLQDYFMEGTKHISTQNIADMLDGLSQAYQNFDHFMTENKNTLEDYLALKQSDEYKDSPLFKIQSLIETFNSTSGYYDVFIPMMKRLSPSYASYCSQMEIANDQLLSQYPDFAKLYNNSK